MIFGLAAVVFLAIAIFQRNLVAAGLAVLALAHVVTL